MTVSKGAEILEGLQGGLVVSCQAVGDEPFNRPEYLAIMARAAAAGGAVGIRANEPDNIRAMRAVVDLPILGIYKRQYPGCDVYITPTREDAAAVVDAGADLVAVDATLRDRPRGETLAGLIGYIREELGRPVMADVSTLDEGKAAADAGADLVATTLAGYTPYSRKTPGPDWELLDELVSEVDRPCVVEGRIWGPEDAAQAVRQGAFCVVVGTAITRPNVITARYVAALAAPE